MFKYLKRQWFRFGMALNAFKREWKFNLYDRTDHVLDDTSFQIMGFGKLKGRGEYPDDTFIMKPPYFGQPVVRIDGHVFTLKYKHYNPTTRVVRYFDTDKPKDGFEVLGTEWLSDSSTLNKEKKDD
jgi:hypothetical protein